MTLARSVLRPLGYNTAAGEFDPAELQALVDASQLLDDRLRLLCLREALLDPETALRVARRAHRFVQATVGASPARRRAAIDLVTPLQHDPEADPRVRLAACWLAVELHSDDWTGFEEGIRTLAGQKEIDWINFMSPTLLSRINPARAATLADALAAPTYSYFHAAGWLKAIASRLDPPSATRLAETLVAGRYAGRHISPHGLVEDVLPALVPHMEAARVDRLIETYLADIRTTRDEGAAENALAIIEALAPHASAAMADKLADLALGQIGVVLGQWPDAERHGLAILTATVRTFDARTAGRVVQCLLQKS